MLRVNPASCMRADRPSAFSMYTVSTPLQGHAGREAEALSEQGAGLLQVQAGERPAGSSATDTRQGDYLQLGWQGNHTAW